MAVTAGMIAKVAATALSNEKLRKGIGWGLVAVLSPVILLIAALCSIGTGGADHNNQAVAAAFYGTSYSSEVPMAFRSHIEDMRTAFSLLDSAVASVNVRTEGGNSLDPIRVKAVFYALCFGEDAPSRRAANRFAECFYTWETRTRTVEVESEDGTVTSTEEYTVAVPVSLHQAYANLEAELGRTLTEDDKSNINHIYTMIAGTEGGGSYDGSFIAGGERSIELDISTFANPTTKNATDLVTYAARADITDSRVFASLGISNMDVVIVGISENMESSILATLQAKEAGVPLVIAKCMSQMPANILKKVGADRDEMAESETGIRLGKSLISGGFQDFFMLSDSFSMVELPVPEAWTGHNLEELDLRKKYSINVIAVKDGEDIRVTVNPKTLLRAEEVLILIGENKELAKMMKNRK